jgi:hypothetical protein
MYILLVLCSKSGHGKASLEEAVFIEFLVCWWFSLNQIISGLFANGELGYMYM